MTIKPRVTDTGAVKYVSRYVSREERDAEIAAELAAYKKKAKTVPPMQRPGQGLKRPKRWIYGRHVKMARAALGLTIKEFADKTGISTNTISNVENAHPSQSLTTETIDNFLNEISWLEMLEEKGESIGVRIHYDKETVTVGVFPKVRERRQPKVRKRPAPVDPNEFEKGMIGSSISDEEWQKEYDAKHPKDGRVGKRSRPVPRF